MGFSEARRKPLSIYLSHEGQRLPRSRCPHCGQTANRGDGRSAEGMWRKRCTTEINPVMISNAVRTAKNHTFDRSSMSCPNQDGQERGYSKPVPSEMTTMNRLTINATIRTATSTCFPRLAVMFPHSYDALPPLWAFPRRGSNLVLFYPTDRDQS
jgi:hypothetical protein